MLWWPFGLVPCMRFCRRVFVCVRFWCWWLCALVSSLLVVVPVGSVVCGSGGCVCSGGGCSCVGAHGGVGVGGGVGADAGGFGYDWQGVVDHVLALLRGVSESEEALKADGTPFVEVSDAEIAAGELLTTGVKPRFPIVISLAAEAVADDEIAPLRSYVSAGGFLMVGSSSFTRNTSGTTRGDFALGAEMGLRMTTPACRTGR